MTESTLPSSFLPYISLLFDRGQNQVTVHGSFLYSTAIVLISVIHFPNRYRGSSPVQTFTREIIFNPPQFPAA